MAPLRGSWLIDLYESGGRIRRYGQGRVVQLYRFLVANSIDEDIFRDRRQADAQSLIQAAAPSETVAPLE